MFSGTFREHPADRHLPDRDRILTGAVLPPPPAPVLGPEAVAEPGLGRLRASLRAHGLALVDLGEPLDDARFVALGHALGVPNPETDPSVVPYVSDGVVLNLVSDRGHTDDPAHQPFSSGSLTLHTESCTKPAAAQPSVLVLMCLDPGDDASAAQTVVVPSAAVLARLDEADRRVLRAVHGRDGGGPPILRPGPDGEEILAFRDFGVGGFTWASEHDTGTVERALRALLAAMYRPDSAYGVHWHRGALVVLDNRRVVHGKTAAADTAPLVRRHLKRMRLREAA